MNLENRLSAFIELGRKLKSLDETFLDELYQNAKAHNSWFTPEEVSSAILGLINYLEPESLKNWIGNYDIPEASNPKKVGVIMAGNIPMVGIHDLLVVLLSGNILYAKLSSQDPYLIKTIVKLLLQIEPGFSDYIQFTEQLKGIDAIIATGSDNTARYFKYYFSKYPHIIRKNRSSCAIIKSTDGEDDFKKLSNDVFQYYGLGCRNVSKLFIPKNFDLIPVLKVFEEKGKQAISNHKFSNNYDYNKSIYLINNVPHLDNGYLMLTENDNFISPISVVFYEYYESENELKEKMSKVEDKIQCVVSNEGWWQNSIDFGEAQNPTISDYADRVDTMKFLLGL